MIPVEIIKILEAELRDLVFGKIELTICVHDGRPRYILKREISIVPGKPTSGAPEGGRT